MLLLTATYYLLSSPKSGVHVCIRRQCLPARCHISHEIQSYHCRVGCFLIRSVSGWVLPWYLRRQKYKGQHKLWGSLFRYIGGHAAVGCVIRQSRPWNPIHTLHVVLFVRSISLLSCLLLGMLNCRLLSTCKCQRFVFMVAKAAEILIVSTIVSILQLPTLVESLVELDCLFWHEPGYGSKFWGRRTLHTSEIAVEILNSTFWSGGFTMIHPCGLGADAELCQNRALAHPTRASTAGNLRSATSQYQMFIMN